jgi:hypothetical protein
MGQTFPLFPTLPVCANYSGFYLPLFCMSLWYSDNLRLAHQLLNLAIGKHPLNLIARVEPRRLMLSAILVRHHRLLVWQ